MGFVKKTWLSGRTGGTATSAAALNDLEQRISDGIVSGVPDATSTVKGKVLLGAAGGAAQVGSDGTVGGSGGTALSPSVVTTTDLDGNPLGTARIVLNAAGAVVDIKGSLT